MFDLHVTSLIVRCLDDNGFSLMSDRQSLRWEIVTVFCKCWWFTEAGCKLVQIFAAKFMVNSYIFVVSFCYSDLMIFYCCCLYGGVFVLL